MSSGFQLAQRQAEAYESFTRLFMDESARLLAWRSEIGSSGVVLDLACGTGLVARHAGPFLGEHGRLVGVDINAAMLEIARRNCDVSVEWIEASCDALPFSDGTFTHVLCQQGVQFFPDPVAAMSETVRVLRPGGKLMATVWATPGNNPYIENQLELLAAIEPALSASARRATPADADGFLRSVAEAAGFDEVTVSMLEHVVDIVDFETWFLAQIGGTPWAPALTAMSDAQRRELVSAMTKRVAAYATPEGVHRIPFRSFCLEARLDT